MAATYVYDANGRLRAVTSDSGSASEYIYDALGNIYAIDSVAAGQLAVFSFTPNHGDVGTSVTIFGQGFSATPASNTVKFHGTTALVSAASTTQLQVSVPVGATTGTISVQVGATSASSIDSFFVQSDSGGVPPTVASFAPVIADASTSVSVTGTNFIASTGPTIAGVGVYTATVTPTSATQLSFTPSAVANSGLVSVSTPYGSAQSAQPLIVVPTSTGAANVISTANLAVDGAAQTINISTANKYGAATFQGTAGQWLTLQLDHIVTTPSSSYGYVKIIGPTGLLLIKETLLNPATGSSQHLPQLPTSGTYLALFYATAGAKVSMGARIESDPTIASTTMSVATTTPGQTKRVLFNGLAGQYQGLNITSMSTTPSGGVISATSADPDPRYNSSWGIYSGTSFSGPGVINFSQFQHTGIFTATLSTGSSSTLSAQVSMIGNPTGTLVNDGPSLNFSTTAPNENVYLTFNATAGQNLSLAIGALTTVPTASTVYTEIYTPSGGQLGGVGGYCYLPGCHYPLTNLPQTGTYLLVVYPNQRIAPSFQATLSTDLTGSLTPNVALPINLARPGQIARITFAGSPGQRDTLYFDSVATNPPGGHVTITVFDTNGTPISYATASALSYNTLNLAALAQTGNYIVQVEADNADTGSTNLSVIPEPQNTITIDGPSVTSSTTVRDENAYLTFSGTAGQNLSLALSGISTSSAVTYVYAEVYTPSGGQIGNELSAVEATGSHLVLPTLTQTGTYTIVIFPSAYVTMNVTTTLSSVLTGSLTPSVALPINLARPGQIARITFAGSPGQRDTLYFDSVATNPAGGHVTITLLDTNGTPVSYATISALSYNTLNLVALTQTGNYTVQVEADNADTGSTNLSVIPEPQNTITIDGPSVTSSTTVRDENAYLTFSGTAGQNLSLALSGISTTPSATTIYAEVYAPNGAQIGSELEATVSTGSHLILPTLTQTGTYTIVIFPAAYVTMNVTATLSSALTGSLTPNVALPINLARPGQIAQLTFAGTTGQYDSIYVDSAATTPSGGHTTITVKNTTGTTVGSVSVLSNGIVDLPALTQTGNYTVQVESDNADTATANVTLSPEPTAPITINGSSVVSSTSKPNQYAYLTFSGTTGQGITVTLSSISTSPSATSVAVYVYAPNGAQVGSGWSIPVAAGGHFSPPALPQTGTYLIRFLPSSAATVTFTTSVTSP